jgi:putative oxidoreductase
MKFFSWILRIAVAFILLQTLFFKFTGAEESVYIFSTVGAEPWGRYASGVIELIAAVLLLVPSTVVYGALLSVAVAAGAILSHLTLLGIEVKGDGGLLFSLAVTIFVCGLALIAIHRRELPILGRVLEA